MDFLIMSYFQHYNKFGRRVFYSHVINMRGSPQKNTPFAGTVTRNNSTELPLPLRRRHLMIATKLPSSVTRMPPVWTVISQIPKVCMENMLPLSTRITNCRSPAPTVTASHHRNTAKGWKMWCALTSRCTRLESRTASVCPVICRNSCKKRSGRTMST